MTQGEVDLVSGVHDRHVSCSADAEYLTNLHDGAGGVFSVREAIKSFSANKMTVIFGFHASSLVSGGKTLSTGLPTSAIIK